MVLLCKNLHAVVLVLDTAVAFWI